MVPEGVMRRQPEPEGLKQTEKDMDDAPNQGDQIESLPKERKTRVNQKEAAKQWLNRINNVR